MSDGTNQTATDFGTFDYIVVGSGSAGGVLAARLSERADLKILLLEAGPRDKSFWIHVPLGFGKTFTDPVVNWRYMGEKEPGLHGRRVYFPRGKVLGGSSAINGMLYVRGAPIDYNLWRQLGAEGWSYEDVLPYFRKSERQARGADKYHGGDGLLNVEDGRWTNTLGDAFIESVAACGVPRNNDFSGATMEGVGYYQSATKGGRRSSSATGFLKAAEARGNLRIETEALVTRLAMEGREARGVLFEKGGVTFRANATREVILAGGAINSPQLLQLSGIGPADLLKRHGIDVLHELPGVGENLADHLMVGRGYESDAPGSFNYMMQNRFRQGLAVAQYLLMGRGPFASGPAPAGAFLKSDPSVEEADIQIFQSAMLAEGGKLMPQNGFQISCYVLRPQSRGHVRIKSADPKDKAAIFANFLDAEYDQRITIAAMRMMDRFVQVDPLKSLVKREVWPGKPLETDEEIIEFVRGAAYSAFHPVGTCKMGHDDMAVVDPQLRVHGIGRLRVIDGSIMPTIASGNTSATCFMIGEKGADMVLASQ
ncbi:MAG: GMC family oxidoreductase N-terminal domain-containing protein [Parvularculaceae bacterium]|nr:GMC family oxidoreductase N-terminal domain-containing protein [Parvularculaceae bacterium]MCB1475317.1 GMC family oxidoreductase N-terminal domain-containing protein [Rhodobiaceae bacterium]